MMRRSILLFILSLLSIAVIAQQKVNGLVEDNHTGDPVSFASVTSEKGAGIMTDSSGKFSFVIRRQAKLNDSITISAAGYSSKKIAVRDLLSNNKVKLLQNDIMLVAFPDFKTV
jgi:hypothetical protein